jgi:glycosyltransferase involved in cell wall biosynthesis
MHILHVAPLWFPVSRDSLGGIETFLAALLRALERRGSRNTLLATGDSNTPAELLPVVAGNLYAQMGAGTALEYQYYEQHQLLLAQELGGDFDVVHSHLGSRSLALSGVPDLRVLHSWHTQVYRDMEWFVRTRPDLWLCAVSEFQARTLRQAGARRCVVIHNGVEAADFRFRAAGGGGGLLFIGRLEEPKGADLAIQVARTLDRALTLAGPIVDREFFARRIQPFLDDRIRYVGTVDHQAKVDLLGRAECVLMPSRVAEAFGIVSLEAMACGTPVVALDQGALPELIEPHVTGFLAQHPDALPDLVNRAIALDRAVIRDRVTARFDIGVVATRYLELYEQVAGGQPGPA